MRVKTDADQAERARASRFRAWLLNELRDREWTQADLAKRSGLSKTTVNKWLMPVDNTNYRRPDYVSLVAVARALGVAIDSILEASSLSLTSRRPLSELQRDAMALIEQLSDRSLELVVPQLRSLVEREMAILTKADLERARTPIRDASSTDVLP